MTRLFVVLAIVSSIAWAQGRHVFVIDSASGFNYSGTATFPPLPSAPVVGQPSNFTVTGTTDMDLTVSGGSVTGGQMVSGGVINVPNLNAVVPNIFSFLPPIATISVTGLTMEVTSAPFSVVGGSFNTMATATVLTGSAAVTALGSTTTTPLAGNQSPPQMVSGLMAAAPGGGIAATVPLNLSFSFTDPMTGASGNLMLTGTLNASYQRLNSDTQTISVSQGGVQTLYLSTGGSFGGGNYGVLASASGTVPGTPIGGGFVLPLNFDALFLQTYQMPNLPPLGNTFSTLDGFGRGVATVTVPGGLPPSLAGLSYDLAYATANGAGGITSVSNSFPLTLVP